MTERVERVKEESNLTELLCGKRISSATVVYKEKDQHLIDAATKNLRDYEESLMLRLRKDGINWAASEKELRRVFISDPTRCALSDALSQMYAVMIPEKAIYSLAT
jgi:hypothetical protein